MPAPWLTDAHIKWILDLAEKHELRLGAQLARQLRLMVGFNPERLFSEIKMLAEMKKAEPNLVLSSSALDQWITADNVDFELLVDAVLHRRWDEVCRLCRQLETLGMPWAEIVSKLQTASWSALQFVSAKGRKPEEMAPLLRTSDKRVFAMTTKFASVSADRAVALHSVAMELSKTSFNETALLGRTNLRLLSALSSCWS